MKKDKLFHLFYSLTPKEVKAFKTFIIGRKPAAISSLVEILSKSKQKDLDFEKIRQKAFKKLFPLDKEQNFRRLMADTLHLLNDFLILAETNANPILRKQLLLEQYKNRTQTTLFQGTVQEIKKELSNNPTRDFHYHQANVNLLNDIYFYERSNKQKERNRQRELLDLHKEMDLSYLKAKLHYAIQLKVLEKITGSNPVSSTGDQLLIQQNPAFEDDPVVRFYQDIINLIDHPNDEDFSRLKSDWFEIEEQFSKNLKIQLFVILINLSWYSQDSEMRVKTAFELYGYAFKTKLLVNAGYVDPIHINNVVDAGISIKEYDKVRAIIRENIPLLREGPDQKENIRNLYESFLLFGEGRFEEALSKANVLQFSHYSYGIRSYVLEIKCLYETKRSNGFEAINTRCKAYKQYLLRKKKEGFLNKEKYEENLNFMKITCQLPFASASKFAKISQEELREKTKAISPIISRTWLLEKIDELK